MATSGSDTPGRGTRVNQEETTPFPLELMLAAARAAETLSLCPDAVSPDAVSPVANSRSSASPPARADETAPFPLEFEVVARRVRQSQDETAPFPLELMVVRPDGEVAVLRTAPVSPRQAAPEGRAEDARVAGSRATVSNLTALPGFAALPALKWHGIDASAELREYAARVASGEKLPPFRGPILASGELPRDVLREPAPRGEMASDSKAFLKLALAALVMSAALFAAAVLGDDAELRAAGEAIGSWLRGPERVLSTFPLTPPAQGSANAPCETAEPLP